MICNSLLHLLNHPAQLGLVSADPGLLSRANARPGLPVQVHVAVNYHSASADQTWQRVTEFLAAL